MVYVLIFCSRSFYVIIHHFMGTIHQPGRLIAEIENDARIAAGDRIMATMCQYFFKRNKIPPNWRENAQLRDAVESYVQLEQDNRHTKNDAERIKRAFLLFLIDQLNQAEMKKFPLASVDEHCEVIKHLLSQRMAHVWHSLDESFIDGALRVRCEKAMRKAHPELFSAPPASAPPVAVHESLISNMPTMVVGDTTPPPRKVDPFLQEAIAVRRRAREASAPPLPALPIVVAESEPQSHVSYTRAGVLLVLLGGAGVAGGVFFAQTVLDPETMSDSQVMQPPTRVSTPDQGVPRFIEVPEKTLMMEPSSEPPHETGGLTFEITLDTVTSAATDVGTGSVVEPEFLPKTYYIKLRTGALPRGAVDLESVKCGVPGTCDIDLAAHCKPVNYAVKNELAHFQCRGESGKRLDFIVPKGGITMTMTNSWQEVPNPIIK